MGMTINSMALNDLQQNFMRLNATNHLSPTKSMIGDAAGSAIAEKMTAMIRSLGQGSANTEDMKHLIHTAEGALNTVSDRLQRVSELTLQAQNGVYSDGDMAIFQNEVNQILDDISSTVQNTIFNHKNLLDGSFSTQNTASGADGTGMQVTIHDMSLETLGLDGFSISHPNAADILAQAIGAVTQQRSELSVISNTFQHTIHSNDITGLNLQTARNVIIDTDCAKEIAEARRERALEEYRMNMRKMQLQMQQQSVKTMVQ